MSLIVSMNPAEGVEADLRPIPFADLAPDGLLKARAELAFRRLQEPYFQWDNVSRVNFEAFPGDAIGRTINGLTLLSQALNQPEPASLKEIMRRVPAVANSDGYLGPKLPESRANEDTMAGHNAYTYGLAEYALWTKDPATKESLGRMVANLFVPARAAIAGYRETSEAKVDWHLSGGDVGQFFTTLDGMTRAYALVPTPEFKATIDTAIDRYRKLDLVGLSAQTHAMLSAATGILRWHEMHQRPEDLAFAETLYKQYRALAMTETFENYNWFNKPQWTEACGVIDSFILTVNLWRQTGRANYLEDAHLILFNGLLPGQLHNGGFGTGPCVGHATGTCHTMLHSEAPFCCSMRGGEGIARAIQYSYFQDKDTVVLPFYSNSTATLRFSEGTCKVRQETGYPHKGQVRLEVLESQVNEGKTWRFFVPSWAVRDSFEIRVYGRKSKPRLAGSFAEIEISLVAGTVVEVAFQQERGSRPALNPDLAQGATRYFDGPLLLGSATENADEPLTPILDLLAAGGRGGEPYVYFPKQKSQPAANAATAGKVPNLAAGAQVFRRDRPADSLPGEVGKLFGALKHDRALAIIGFVWSKQQNVRQVILQWPESGAMPKPEEIALRWSDAGELHTAAQPGIIGNGRQWIYTLGNAPEGAAVDNLVLAGKSAEVIPDALAVPDVEVIGRPIAAPVEANQVTEVPLASAKTYGNPFMDAQIDAVVTQPDGKQLRVPGFWAGGNHWKFRYASEKVGTHTWRVECSDTANAGLHGVKGSIEVLASTSTNPLYLHGPVRVAQDRRHFEHADGTPFFWLGDTWWKCLCKRMTWEGFQELAADRKAKGFNVVQIVCGPYPDENMMEARWENEGGKPYETLDFSVMNPVYFDYADRRFQHLIDNGMVPAIVGGWGRPQGGGQPTIVQVGLEGYKRHWRHLIARFGAYPVVWILGGEASDGNGPWSDLGKYVYETDPYRRLLVYHSPSDPRQAIKANNELFDFDMVGIGHDGMNTAGQTLSLIKSSLTQTPARPALCGEACYEGHMQTNFQDIQRHMFWSFVLSGAAGHTYGAAGIWHASVEGDAGHTGIHGQEYDFTTWKEGMGFPGATQVGLGKKLLDNYPWHRFEPHSEWVDEGLFAAGIPGELIFVYLPKRGIYDWSGFTVSGLTPGTRYAGFFFDPATGRRFDTGIATNIDGTWTSPNVPSPQDWVLVLERARD